MSDIGLLMTLVSNIHEILMTAVINNGGYFWCAFKGEDIEIVETLGICKECSSKALNSRTMSKFTIFMTIDLIFFPKMYTFDNMSEIS